MIITKHARKAEALRQRVRNLYAGGQGLKPAEIARKIGYTYTYVYRTLWPNGKPVKMNGEKQAEPDAKPPVLVDMRKMASKGGDARAAKLSAERRKEIARKAALAGVDKRRAKAEAAQ
jgi:hypothetical protein